MFYRLWRHARLQIDSIVLPTLNVSIAVYMLWSHARLQFDSIGFPSLNVSVAFYLEARVQVDSIGLPTLNVSITKIQPGPSPRTHRIHSAYQGVVK